MGKRKFKRKRLWTTKEEELLLEVWNSNIYKLRGARRNYHVVEEIKHELDKRDCVVSVMEVKNKIHNLTTKYAKEKSVTKQTGSPSTWSLYSKVHRILGRFHKTDKNLIEEIIDSDDEISQSLTKLSSIHAKNDNSSPNKIVICRSCVGECTNFKSLYKIGILRGEKTTLATLLTLCTNLEFSHHENTNLPGFICANCIHELTRSYIFIKKVQEADKLFRVQLNSKNNMENDEVQKEQCEIKVENENESDFNKTKDILELPEVVNEDKRDPNTYKKAEDYMEYILQEERSDIDYETLITKEETKLQEIDEIKVKSEIEDYDIQKMYTDSQPEKQYVESNMNPLEITPNTKQDNCVVNRLVNKNPSDIHFIICKICSKQFRNKLTFKYHMQQMHSDSNKYNVCDKAFKTICAFEEHKSTHFPNIYDRSRRQPSNLKIHPSETETFTCHICGKQLSRMWSYKIHMLIHKGEKRSRKKPFSCDICGIAFYTYKKMWSHRNNHGGLRKFKCSKCLKRFSTAEQLERHMLGHTKMSSFNCKICSQTFNRETSLLIHLRFHEEIVIS